MTPAARATVSTRHAGRRRWRGAATGVPASRAVSPVLVAVLVLLLSVQTGSAAFSTSTGPAAAQFLSAGAEDFKPTAVTSTRTSSTSCSVSWTPAAGTPASARFDVVDAAAPGTVLVSGATSPPVAATVSGGATTLAVRARIGTWQSTYRSAASPCPAATPGAPTGVTAVPGSSRADVSWTPPAANGVTVTGYTATATSGGSSFTCTATPPATTCRISGLTNGTAYAVTVTASGSGGAGPASAPVSVTPQNAQAPSGVRAVGSSSALVVSWTPAAAGGVPDTYLAEVLAPASSAVLGSCQVAPPATTCTVTGLTDLVDHVVRVGAVDPSGTYRPTLGTAGTPSRAGALASSGAASSGALGVGVSATTAGQVGSATTWSSVSAGADHTCATRTDGTLWCWGTGFPNGLGGVDVSSPTQVGSVTTWSSVAALGYHSCATRTDGSLWCWGLNVYGELGQGDTTDRSTPTRVGTGTAWVSVGGTESTTCATQTDGSLWCWGDNTWGQVGDGTTQHRSSPVRIGVATTWSQVAQGYTGAHVCALRTDGTVWCWGRSAEGQAGSGTAPLRTTAPAQVGTGTTWDQVAIGGDNTCARRTDRTLWCWGLNTAGQVGNGTSGANVLSPVQVASAVVGVRVGYNHSCLTTGTGTADATLSCWGDASTGQTGLGHHLSTLTPSALPAPAGWTGLGLGLGQSCAVRVGGTLWCWGVDDNQLGRPQWRSAVASVPAATTWTVVDAGRYSTCGVRSDGTLWCWGENDSGQVGDGTTTQRSVPVQVGTATTWADVSVGGSHACGRQTDGGLWCWGANGSGQLGLGTTSTSLLPVQVGSSLAWLDVAAGTSHTCATRTDASLWCWGLNSSGQLGDSSTVTRTSPTRVGTGTDWVDVDAGEAHTCGVRAPGTLWCWGSNAVYQLGVGNSPAMASIPVQVGVVTTWVDLDAGRQHTCARRADATAWCWGYNATGQLGLGTTVNRNAPQQVPSTTWSGLFAGADSTCGRSVAGALWCWGDNAYGQLGRARANPNAPFQVTVAATDVVALGTDAALFRLS